MRIQRIGRITADYFVDRTYDLATSGNEEGEQAREAKCPEILCGVRRMKNGPHLFDSFSIPQ